MAGGCTDCGRKGGCAHRKDAMFRAIDQALARLYPDRRWDNLDEDAAFDAGPSVVEMDALASTLARRLGTQVMAIPGPPGDRCDYLYALCLGRPPSLLAWRHGGAPPDAVGALMEEKHLRVAVSSLGRMAAIQEVTLSAAFEDDQVVLREAPRSGVFEPSLLPRMRQAVAVLAEHDLRHLDFGEIHEPPPGFDDRAYVDTYGCHAALCNYLFFAEPATTVTTTVMDASVARRPSP